MPSARPNDRHGPQTGCFGLPIGSRARSVKVVLSQSQSWIRRLLPLLNKGSRSTNRFFMSSNLGRILLLAARWRRTGKAEGCPMPAPMEMMERETSIVDDLRAERGALRPRVAHPARVAGPPRVRPGPEPAALRPQRQSAHGRRRVRRAARGLGIVVRRGLAVLLLPVAGARRQPVGAAGAESPRVRGRGPPEDALGGRGRAP